MTNAAQQYATEAVEAAARKAFEEGRREAANLLPVPVADRLDQWDELSPLLKRQWGELVMPIVWAALEAVPDQRHEAWLVGHLAPSGAVNPYPSTFG